MWKRCRVPPLRSFREITVSRKYILNRRGEFLLRISETSLLFDSSSLPCSLRAPASYLETPGHFSPIAWATVQKPVAIATEEKSSRLNSKITNASENFDSKGTEQARKKGESEKPSDNIGEEEEEGGLCQYERVSSDKDGKLCSDISVDRLGIEKISS